MSNNKRADTKSKLKSDAEPKQRYLVYNSLITYYLLIMFSFFTLFLTKKYSNARHDKLYLFLGLTAILAVSVSISYALSRAKLRREGNPLKPFFTPLSVVDIAFLVFLGCAVISAIGSGRFGESFIAEYGRNNGLLLMLAYTLVFFIISRLCIFKDFVLAVYLISSCVIALLTLINFYYIDPFCLFENYSESVVKDFGSTIGNKNLISSYMSLFLPAAIMTFVINEKRYMRIISCVAIVFGYIGALTANSSSVILGLGIALPVMAIFSARSFGYMKRFLLSMAVMFASAKLILLWQLIVPDNKGFEFIQSFLINSPLTYIPIIVFAALYAVMCIVGRKGEPRFPTRVITAIIAVLLFAGIAGTLIAVMYFTYIDTSAKLGSFDRLLRFDDRWGTHRGFMWIRSLREYGGFDFFKKLFGAGPDTAYYVLEPYFRELNARFNDASTNTAHNEYINYLITQGLFGLVSYLTIIFGVCIRAVRRSKSSPAALIFVSAIICYAAQAVVNIYQPITTPIFIIFIALAENFNRNAKLNRPVKVEKKPWM